MVGGNGLSGAVLQAEAGVAVECGWDAVAVLNREVEDAAAGRDAVCHNETVEAKIHVVRNKSIKQQPNY